MITGFYMVSVAQREMLSILKEIDRICVKHDIQYWAHGGTLLGAIRHRGFIPWDDDCDVCMMREDFERFEYAATQELRKDLFFQTRKTEPCLNRNCIKIRSSKIKIVESREKENELYHQGVFVDIFVYDYYPAWAVPVFRMLRMLVKVRERRLKYRTGTIKRRVLSFLTFPIVIAKNILAGIFNPIWKRFRLNKSFDYVGAAVEHADYGSLVRKNDVFPLEKKIQFEDFQVPVPFNSVAILTHIFGEYMNLPPENERVGHAKLICYFNS